MAGLLLTGCYWKQVLRHSVTEDEEGVVWGKGMKLLGLEPEFLGLGVGLLGSRRTTFLGDRRWVTGDRLLEYG